MIKKRLKRRPFTLRCDERNWKKKAEDVWKRHMSYTEITQADYDGDDDDELSFS